MTTDDDRKILDAIDVARHAASTALQETSDPIYRNALNNLNAVRNRLTTEIRHGAIAV